MSALGSCTQCCKARPLVFTLPIRTKPILHRTYATPAIPREPTKDELLRRSNPLLASYLKLRRDRELAERRKQHVAPLDDETPADLAGADHQQGDLAPNSIFHYEASHRRNHPAPTARTSYLGQRVPPTRLLNLDPMPHRRRRWERNMLIRDIRRRGRLTRDEIIKRTEREYQAQSGLFKTSMKKLSPLANQIAGKSVDDALVQLRFSKKKVAVAVREHLELARDQAIVERGMGLGKAEGRTGTVPGKQIGIRTKGGEKLKIEDRTSMYVAQAWVNKGRYGQDINRRARGRTDRLRLPQTSISVLLKEEATRIREHGDREKRAQRKKLWTPLPDRPLTEQRQYYCW